MKKTLLTLIFLSSLFASKAQTTSFEWTKSFYGLGNSFPSTITTDKLGNVYTVGHFNNTIDCDPGVGVHTLSSFGYSDIYVSKLDSAGNFIWAHQFGDYGSDSGAFITMDLSGNLVITGGFFGSIDFDSGLGTSVLTAGLDGSVFFLKLNSDGDFIWVKQVYGANASISSRSLVIDRLGNIIVTGQYQGTGSVDADPGVGVYNLPPSVGNFDIYISKLDSVGNFIWAKGLGGISTDIGMSIVVDSMNNVYTSGIFSYTVDFNSGTGAHNVVSEGAGSKDVFILKLNALGDFVWVKNFGSTGNEACNYTKMDRFGNLYTTGSYNGNTDFDPSVGVLNLNLVGYRDVFVSKIDTAGNFIWAKNISGPNYEEGISIDVDKVGNCYTTGYYTSVTDFDPGVGTFSLTPIYSDMFITKLNPLGDFVWVKSVGSTSGVRGLAIHVDDFYNVYTSGWFGGTADFDPEAATTNTLTSGSSFNIFIQKLSQIMTTSVNELVLNENGIYFYPNPNNGLFTVDTKKTSQVIITNMLGQDVFHENISSGKQSLQMPEVVAGIYTLTVISDEKKQTFKFIKQ